MIQRNVRFGSTTDLLRHHQERLLLGVKRTKTGAKRTSPQAMRIVNDLVNPFRKNCCLLVVDRSPTEGVCQSASACTEDGKLPPDRNWSIRLHSHRPRHATISLCMDRLDRSQVEIKASRDTRTGFITLDPSCKTNPKRPQIEANRRKVQEMQRIRVFGNDNRPFLLCLSSCCRSVSGLLPICYRRVSDVFSTCSR